LRPRRLRATRVAAAAPNSRIIGGAGTGVPPDELDEEPPLEELELLLELDELLLDEEELEPLVLPDEPKLLDPPLAPELVELVEVDEVAPLLPWLDEPDEPWLDEPDEPWLELPWLELPWLDDPWPLLDEPWLDEPPFWFWFWFSFWF
jgi:hypothetical protein